MMLADLGADVIKIESPEGDPYRAYQGGQYSPHFQAYNRNKRSLSLDMKLKSGLRALRPARQRGGRLHSEFPAGNRRPPRGGRRAAACSQSAAGVLLHQRLRLERPLRDRPSYDSVAQALSGFLSVVVDNRRPQFLGPALADAITGMYASQGILAALVQRGRSGRGAHVEVSMLEAMAHFAVEPFAAFFALGETPTSADRPRLAQAYILRTADQRLIAIHLSSLEKFWTGPGRGARCTGTQDDPRFNPRERRIAEYETLRVELDNRFLAPAPRALDSAPAGGGRALRTR